MENLANFVKEKGKYGIDAWVPKEEKKDDLPDAESVGKAAEAATKAAESVAEKVGSAASGATEAVKSALKDDSPDHDEL